MECQVFSTCKFVNKYMDIPEVRLIQYIEKMCKGDSHCCKRLAFQEIHGESPCDDLMPTGQKFSVRHLTLESSWMFLVNSLQE